MHDELTSTAITRLALAKYFHATKSRARCMLVDVMYASQADGFVISQGTYTTQVRFQWSHEIEAPSWAIEHNLCQTGTKLSQSVELVFTGRESLSILLRVYRGHCHSQTDWQHVTMKQAAQALQNPAGLV